MNSNGVRFNRYGLVVLAPKGHTRHDSALSAFSHQLVRAGGVLVAVPAVNKEKGGAAARSKTTDGPAAGSLAGEVAAAPVEPAPVQQLYIRLTLEEARTLAKRELNQLFEQARRLQPQLELPAALPGEPVFDDED